MKTEKEKLQAKTVDQLKRHAKKVGAKIVTPEGKAKTKEQLVNSIVMKQRLSGKTLGAKSVTKKPVAKKPVAKKIVARNYNKLINFIDVPDIKSFRVVNLKASNKGYRFRITDMISGESIVLPFVGRQTYPYQEAILYLKSIGIKIVGKASLGNATFLYTKDLAPRLKK